MFNLSRQVYLYFSDVTCRPYPLRRFFLIFLLLLSGGAHAQSTDDAIKAPSSVLAIKQLKNNQTISLSANGLFVTAKRIPTDTGWVINISGKTRHGRFDIRKAFRDVTEYPDDILIAEIDPTNGYPEIMFSAFTGGAHCCALPVFAEELNGKWTTISYPMVDGGPPLIEDIDHDGVAEILVIDQRFLYSFDCYACSWSPLRIDTIRNGKIVDITRSEAGLARNKKHLSDMELEAAKNTELWHQNGFLAGWVAVKALLGQELDAWKKMLALYDRDSNFELFECKLKIANDYECPEDQRIKVSFPVSLEKFLIANNYIKEKIEQ